jgi:hypothetical protein
MISKDTLNNRYTTTHFINIPKNMRDFDTPLEEDKHIVA